MQTEQFIGYTILMIVSVGIFMAIVYTIIVGGRPPPGPPLKIGTVINEDVPGAVILQPTQVK